MEKCPPDHIAKLLCYETESGEPFEGEAWHIMGALRMLYSMGPLRMLYSMGALRMLYSMGALRMLYKYGTP